MMRNRTYSKRVMCVTWLAAGLMAVGATGLGGCNKDETGKTPGDKAADVTKKTVDSTTQAAGDATAAAAKAAKDAKDGATAAVAPSGTSKLEDARSTLEGIVEKAGKRNDWNAMADHFTKADADRVKASKQDTKDLDDLADKFADSWSKKYGGDKFSVMAADKVFAPEFLKLATDPSGTKDVPKATGTIAGGHGMPDLSLAFVGEGGKWRLDIPDTVDGKKLHDNLLAALTALQDSSTWDADKVTAARGVAHRILAAVMDKPASSSSASAE